MSAEFFGKIENGKWVWDKKEKVACKNWMASKHDGEHILEIKRVTKRSKSQVYIKGCGYLFGVVYAYIFRDSWQDIPTIHSAMKNMFLKGFREIELPDGETLVVEYVRSLKHEEGDVEDEELWNFITQVRDFALHTLGIVTPDPDPNYKSNHA